MEQGVAISKPWSLIHKDVFSETSEWLNTVSGSVLLHHHRPSEGVELEVVELEEFEDEQEEIEEEVVIGVAEAKNDEMSDEGMEEADAVNLVKDGEKEEEKNLSAQKRKEVLQFSEEPWEGEEFLLGNRLSHGPAAEMHSHPRRHVSGSTVLD